MKTGILANGYDVDQLNWLDVVWGKPPHLLGRLPRTAQLILRIKPEVIIFGSGSSKKDGKIEAAWMKDTLVDRFYGLKKFSVFQEIHLTEETREQIKGAILETESKNTGEEVKFAMEIFIQQDVQEVIIVSSPDHFERCARDALIAAGSKLRIQATHSDTPYGGNPGEVIIVEPKHPFHSFIKKLMTLNF